MKNNLTMLGSNWWDALVDAIKDKIITPVLVLLAAAGVIYAIVVGIRFAKADDKSAREEAKAKLIYVLIGIGVTLVLIALFLWLSGEFNKKDSSINKWKDNLLPTGEYVVEYIEGDGAGQVSDSRANKGQKFTLASAPTAPNGKEFDGWSVEGLTGTYKAGDEITIPEDSDKKVTITANWKAAAQPNP